MEKVSLKKQLPENPSDDTKDLTETIFSSNSSQEDSRIIYTNENCVLCRDTNDAFRLKKQCEKENGMLYQIHHMNSKESSQSCLLYPCQENITHDGFHAGTGITVYDRDNIPYVIAEINRKKNGSVKNILLCHKDDVLQVSSLKDFQMQEWKQKPLIRKFQKKHLIRAVSAAEIIAIVLCLSTSHHLIRNIRQNAELAQQSISEVTDSDTEKKDISISAEDEEIPKEEAAAVEIKEQTPVPVQQASLGDILSPFKNLLLVMAGIILYLILLAKMMHS